MQGSIQVPTEAKMRPPRRWKIVALQALWFITAALVVEAWVLGIRPAFLAVSTVCEGPNCLSYQITPAGLAELESLGLSLGFYAFYQTVLSLFTASVYAGMSLLIFRARPNDPMALYVSLVLLPFGTFMIEYAETLSQLGTLMNLVAGWAPALTLIGFAILCLVFPDGKFVPRWTRWAAWMWFIAPLSTIVGVMFGLELEVEAILTVVLLGLVLVSLIAPIYRYRRISSYTQRQQTKWVIFGLVQLLATIAITTEVLPRINPVFDLNGSLADLILTAIQVISIATLPVTFTIATLRHRLWNVDVVLNRTLVYVPLTSILTVIYTTSIAVSQRLFSTVAGDQPQAVAIFTTIILTATFTPIKNWLQDFVDKHFKEAPGRFKELKELDKQLSQVALALDPAAVAKQVVTQVLAAYGARAGALYLRRGDEMVLLYATPEWVGEEGEVSLLLAEEGRTVGRLLLSRPGNREDYTLDEVDNIVAAATPVVCNLHRLECLQANLASPHARAALPEPARTRAA